MKRALLLLTAVLCAGCSQPTPPAEPHVPITAASVRAAFGGTRKALEQFRRQEVSRIHAEVKAGALPPATAAAEVAGLHALCLQQLEADAVLEASYLQLVKSGRLH